MRSCRLTLACILFAAMIAATACTREPSISANAPVDGESLVGTKCTSCHSLDRVNGAKKTKQGWNLTIGRMISNGLVVTDDEKAAIVDYLTARDAQR